MYAVFCNLSSLVQVAYLCIYGSTTGSAPKPTDEAVDGTAIKMLEDMTKIAAEVRQGVVVVLVDVEASTASYLAFQKP